MPLLVACLMSAGPALSSWEDAGRAIRPEALRAHLELLADDGLEGRGTGSRGHELAVRYLRAQLQSLGLVGGAGDGGYLQQVPLRRTQVIGEKTTLLLGGSGTQRRLAEGVDFTVMDTHLATVGGWSGPVVLAGHGITAKELGYDDYDGLDVRGKIVAVVSDAPSSFPATRLAYYSDHDTKREIAAAHGARGMLELRTPDTERRFPFPFLLRELSIGWNSLRWLDASGRPDGLGDDLGPWVVLSAEGAGAFLEGESPSADAVMTAVKAGRPPRFAMRRPATLAYAARHTALSSPNVVAVLEGSDPVLRNEYLVYTAHTDHLGLGPARDGDAIYNGALDNAAGCAVLLEVARAFAALGERPRRSVLFVGVTAEEAGLLGSDYFARHPTVPAAAIVANLNIDGGASFQPVVDVIAWGDEHSSLGGVARSAAAETGFTLSPDPFPEETLFARSDQYSFVKQGIPALFLELGFRSADPTKDPLARFREWLVTVYHSPRDDASQPFDYATGARFARFAFRVGHVIAMDPVRPRWKPGDFFGERFGRTR